MLDRFAIIPVLDLKLGKVVRARAGDRANYRPIETRLAKTSAAEDVLAGLLTLAPFGAVYIADLDAIEGSGDHGDLVRALHRRFPALEIWLDRGCADAADALAVARDGLVPVLGSETVRDAAVPARLNATLGGAGYVLSLDHRGDAFIGPQGLAASAESWPDRVIVMTLDRVGSDTGPDFAKLAGVKARAGARQIYAAGGVRGPADTAALRVQGIAGALVASALHDGRLPAAAL